MRTFLITVFTVLAVLGMSASFMIVDSYGKMVNFEENIESLDQVSMNTLSNTTLTVMDMLKIADRHTDKLKEMVEYQFTAKYSDEGAMLKFFADNNIEVPTELFNSASLALQAGRAEFKLTQDRKVEYCASYRKMLRSIVTGKVIMQGIFGAEYPEAKCNIILEQGVKDKFESGVDKGIV